MHSETAAGDVDLAHGHAHDAHGRLTQFICSCRLHMFQTLDLSDISPTADVLATSACCMPIQVMIMTTGMSVMTRHARTHRTTTAAWHQHAGDFNFAQVEGGCFFVASSR